MNTAAAHPRIVAVVFAIVAFVPACGGGDDEAADTPTRPTQTVAADRLPQGSEPVDIDPANFVAEIDNPWWPMRRGSRWVYREQEADATTRIVVTVTDRKKTILGVAATVVHDVVYEDGEVKEDTFDWYAQDKAGNVWYLGEDTKEYENGKISSTAGSWEAGVDGAQAGVIMPAEPKVGLAYREEYYKGDAEDRAEVLSLDKNVKVPFGAFANVLETKETTPLEPDVEEHKYYARGVGPVLVRAVSGGGGSEKLIRFTRG